MDGSRSRVYRRALFFASVYFCNTWHCNEPLHLSVGPYPTLSYNSYRLHGHQVRYLKNDSGHCAASSSSTANGIARAAKLG